MVYLKVLIIAVVAFVISFASVDLLAPSSEPLLLEYKQKYAELKAKPEVSDEELAALDAMFQQLNSAKNIEADFKEVVIKGSVFFALVLPLVFMSARLVNMSNNGFLAAAALIGLAFIAVGSVVSGGLLGAIFAVTGLSKNLNAQRSAAS
jgi:hypothetical protein